MNNSCTNSKHIRAVVDIYEPNGIELIASVPCYESSIDINVMWYFRTKDLLCSLVGLTSHNEFCITYRELVLFRGKNIRVGRLAFLNVRESANMLKLSDYVIVINKPTKIF